MQFNYLFNKISSFALDLNVIVHVMYCYTVHRFPWMSDLHTAIKGNS